MLAQRVLASGAYVRIGPGKARSYEYSIRFPYEILSAGDIEANFEWMTCGNCTKPELQRIGPSGTNERTPRMQIAMRSYFSSNHVSAAQLFASRATEIEDSHSGRSRFDMNHRAFVLGAVVELAVFLECAINELYKDCLDGHGAYISTLSQASIAALASEWTNWHAKGRTYKPTLDKYEAALATCGATAFNWGCQTCQDATLLVKLRNTLVHYTPESIVANDPHKLGDALRPKFQENRLMQGSGNPYFPDKCLGAGCADWAIKVALSFANDFFDRIGVKPNYQRI